MTILGPIVIEPGTFDLLNLGDVAMLQVAVARLRVLAPLAELQVLTHDAEALAAHCPGVLPLSAEARRDWFAERFFLGSAHALMPRGASRRLASAQHGLRQRYPRFMRSAMRLRARIHKSNWLRMRSFLEVMEHASFLVIAGQHTIADAFHARTRILLETLEFAVMRGIPTAMVGQGIGPLTDRELIARARDVLPAVGLIAVREPDVGPPVLRALGVSDERVVVTGDDAVGPAFAASAHATRESMGISLRVTPVAGVDTTIIDRVRVPLGAFARSRGVSIIPLPSAYKGVATDDRTLHRLLDGDLADITGRWGEPKVASLIERVGTCRVVVAGAYHVAVFALSQGIPVVAIARSGYYASKYAGLRSIFGSGCETILLDDPEFDEHLREAMDRAWERADDLRPQLLEKAKWQVSQGEAALARAVSMATPVAHPRTG